MDTDDPQDSPASEHDVTQEGQAQHDTERDHSPEPDEGGGGWSRFVRIGGLLIIVFVVVLLVSTFLVQPFRIPSSSMEPTLRVGDRVLVNKLAYRFGNHPERGDVVVFDGTGSFAPEGERQQDPLARLVRAVGARVGLLEPSGNDYVKRVIAVGGDRVTCCDDRGRVQVNGVSTAEDYLHQGDEPSAVPFDVRVPEGRLWVMGDHRSASSDSRDHLGSPGGGSVPTGQVIGRVDWIGWPVARWETVASTAGHELAERTGGPRRGSRG